MPHNIRAKIENFQYTVYGHWLLGYFLPLINYIILNDIKNTTIGIFDCKDLNKHIYELPLWKERQITLTHKEYKDTILLPSYEVATKNYKDNYREQFYSYNNYPSLIYPAVKYLKTKYLGKKFKKIDFLIVSRKKTSTNTAHRLRLINNLEELYDRVKKDYNNVELVDLSTLNFKQQVNYMYNSAIIFGQCGSALHNVIFCRPNSLCIEYDFQDRPQNKILCDYAGVNHSTIKDKPKSFKPLVVKETTQILNLDIPAIYTKIDNITMQNKDNVNTELYRNFLKDKSHKINLYMDNFLNAEEMISIWETPRAVEGDIHGRDDTIFKLTIPPIKKFLSYKLKKQFPQIFANKDFIVENIVLLNLLQPTKPHIDGHYPFFTYQNKKYCMTKVCVSPIVFDTELDEVHSIETKLITFKQHYNYYIYGGLEFELLLQEGKTYKDFDFENQFNEPLPKHKNSFIPIDDKDLWQHVTYPTTAELQYGLDIDTVYTMHQGSIATINPNQIHCTEGYNKDYSAKWVLRFCICERFNE